VGLARFTVPTKKVLQEMDSFQVSFSQIEITRAAYLSSWVVQSFSLKNALWSLASMNLLRNGFDPKTSKAKTDFSRAGSLRSSSCTA
jgi:hypothetical protein